MKKETFSYIVELDIKLNYDIHMPPTSLTSIPVFKVGISFKC